MHSSESEPSSVKLDRSDVEVTAVAGISPLEVIDRSGFAGFTGAVRTTVKGTAAALDSVPGDPHAALAARWGQLVDRTFEAVESVPATGRDYVERPVIIVSADLTLGHNGYLHSGEVAIPNGLAASSAPARRESGRRQRAR
jgi:hypothetical protein